MSKSYIIYALYFDFGVYTALVGIQASVLRQLLDLFSTSEQWQRYVCVTFDEMKIKEKLVYNSSGWYSMSKKYSLQMVTVHVM